MDFKKLSDLPNLNVIFEKMNTSKEKIDTAFVGEVVFEAIDQLIVENRDKFHICDNDAMNLAISLITSIFMTCLAYPLGDDKEKLKELVKDCGIPIEAFTKRSEKLKKHKEFDA